MKIKLMKFVLVVLLFCIADLVQAVPVTIQISGNITSASGSGLPSTIYDGVSFLGTYTYDTSTPDSYSSAYSGYYQHSSPYGINLSLGGYQFQTAANHIGRFDIEIGNDDPGPPLIGPLDYYLVCCNAFIPIDGITINSFTWNLHDTSYTAISSDALPVTAPVLTDWEFNKFYIFGSGNNGDFSITGTITEAVPEPLTISLLAIGLILCNRRR
ncbi:MAG: PEP-CTERM sorting domain-containing protein [Phycisphaerales bacterium]